MANSEISHATKTILHIMQEAGTIYFDENLQPASKKATSYDIVRDITRRLFGKEDNSEFIGGWQLLEFMHSKASKPGIFGTLCELIESRLTEMEELGLVQREGYAVETGYGTFPSYFITENGQQCLDKLIS